MESHVLYILGIMLSRGCQETRLTCLRSGKGGLRKFLCCWDLVVMVEFNMAFDSLILVFVDLRVVGLRVKAGIKLGL